jgi:rod shape-determining protein MreD
MINLARHIGNFIALVFIQIIILNHLNFSGFVNPYLYVLFILLLPFETPKWALLFLSFTIGFTIDIFTQTYGMHAFACVLTGYTRPYVLNIFAPRDGYDSGTLPNARFMGLEWFLRYATILVFVHHFTLFFVESFSFTMFFATLLRIILSVLATLLLITISQLLILRR